MSGYLHSVNKPTLTGNEFEYMQDAIQRGQISGDGYYSKLCHATLEEKLGVLKVMLTTFLHPCSGDGSPAAGYPARRRGDHSLIYLRLHGECIRPARR